MNAPADARVYLSSYLAPFAEALSREDVTDIYVNRPGEVWVETLGGEITRSHVPTLTEATLRRLARQIAAKSHQGISREHPLLSATLPDGARVQVVTAPATRAGTILAIRKHVAADLRLEDYASAGSFAADPPSRAGRTDIADHLQVGQVAQAIRLAVRSRLNILVSGGTASGKTTFLNALLREIPAHERLVFIEDAAEIRIDHDNAVGLLATRGELGEAAVSANDLVTASLRLRPDRIILGELRGPEAFAFLRAVNTGHPGSITTIHANSSAGAVEQLVLLVVEGGTTLSRDDVAAYVRSTVGLYVHIERSSSGRRIKASLTPD